MLEAVACLPCCTERESWCRIVTVRDGVKHLSDVSIALARRLMPRLLNKHKVHDHIGMYTGHVFLIRG